jgi:hypothetical protein
LQTPGWSEHASALDLFHIQALQVDRSSLARSRALGVMPVDLNVTNPRLDSGR